jgi:hypothetical protein
MNPRVFLDVDQRPGPMNASVTDELIGALAELRSLFPDWRFGQLVANLALAAGRDGDGGVWEVEDEQLLAAARRLTQRNRAQQEA